MYDITGGIPVLGRIGMRNEGKAGKERQMNRRHEVSSKALPWQHRVRKSQKTSGKKETANWATGDEKSDWLGV